MSLSLQNHNLVFVKKLARSDHIDNAWVLTCMHGACPDGGYRVVVVLFPQIDVDPLPQIDVDPLPLQLDALGFHFPTSRLSLDGVFAYLLF